MNSRVRIPWLAVIRAIPQAIAATARTTADDHDPGSPGGAKIAPIEVVQAITAFVTTLAAALAVPIARANGVDVKAVEQMLGE